MKGKNRIEIEGLPKNSLARDTWRRLLSNKAAVFGSIIMILIILMAIFADVLYDYETQVIAMDIPNSLKAPCAEYPLGTDEFGRDTERCTCEEPELRDYGNGHSVACFLCEK